MRKLFKEPLIHFAGLAVLVFCLWTFFETMHQQRAATIHISEADLERMAALYTAEAGSLPSERDMRAMVTDIVTQRALVREAKKLALDEGDTVIDRRLEQKMRFILEDRIDIKAPDEDVLIAYFEANAAKYQQAATYGFDHVFLKEGSTQDDLLQIASELENGNAWTGLGDPFMLQRQYAAIPERELVRIFGAGFAEQLSALDAGAIWQGPITSAFGQHFVRLRSKSEPRLPAFEDVKDNVESDWYEDERRRLNAENLADILEQYTVIIDAPGAK